MKHLGAMILATGYIFLEGRDLVFFLLVSLVVSCDIRPGLFFYFVTTGQISNPLASKRLKSCTVLVSAQDHSCQNLLEFCCDQPSADARHFQLVSCLSSTSHLSVVSLIISIRIGPHCLQNPQVPRTGHSLRVTLQFGHLSWLVEGMETWRRPSVRNIFQRLGFSTGLEV